MPQHNTTQPIVRALIRFFSQWINSEASFIFWLVILSLTFSGINYNFVFADTDSFIFESLIFVRDAVISFFCVILLDLFIYIPFRKFKTLLRTIKSVFIAANIIIFIADIFAVYYYRMPFNGVMADIAFTTNVRECAEFLKVYVADYNFCLFIISAAISLYLIRKVSTILFSHMRRVMSVMLVLAFIAGMMSVVRDARNSNMKRPIDSIGMLRLTKILRSSIMNKMNYEDALYDEPAEVVITKDESSIPYVIFILGESTNRNHMSLYGYELQTNPVLSNRKLYIFDDTVSPHAATILSMQKLFTFYTYGSNGEWYTYTSLFRILNKANYHTFWISNQEPAVGTNAIISYSAQCDTVKFTRSSIMDNINAQDGNYDETILPFLDDALKTEYRKNFYVLHLLGTHAHYHKRYPKEYEKFSAKDETFINGLTNSYRKIRASYDNAVLYNDYIVDEIIKRFEDKNAIVIYVSDHSEDVYDDSMNFPVHAEGIISKTMIEIPFIIWVSDKFSKSYPEIEQRIASSIHRPYMTDDMIHTLLDIMSIETPEYDPTKSIINVSFDITRPRIYSGHVYNKDTGLSALQ